MNELLVTRRWGGGQVLRTLLSPPLTQLKEKLSVMNTVLDTLEHLIRLCIGEETG